MKTIDVIICRLRKKLAVAGVPSLIDTVWGCGYILRDPSLDSVRVNDPQSEAQTGMANWAARAAVAA
jgi:two-component system, cell cycle response regulator CtrA